MTDTNGKVWKVGTEQDKLGKCVPEEFKIGNENAKEIFSHNRATLLAVSYSTFSDPVIESFISACPSNLPQIVIRPILNPVKWLLWSKLITCKSNSYSIRGDLPGAIDVFGMENKYAGYVFLIDSVGKIRWKAAGTATTEEITELETKFKQLTITMF